MSPLKRAVPDQRPDAPNSPIALQISVFDLTRRCQWVE
nr:MAG TPA: hypothetical protein [Caudoviricetes sp.]